MGRLRLQRLRNAFYNMHNRCENTNHQAYKYYGAQGVQVCERWHKFENFFEDMGLRPKGKTLDRWPNNAGNYEPGNCRWATWKQQNNNRRNSITADEKRRYQKPRKKGRTVKTKMIRLISLLGGGSEGRISVAKRLGLALGYVYRLEKGLKPGKHLYEALVRLCKELEAKNGKIS